MSHDWIEPEHIPDHPAVDCAGVGVAGQTGRSRRIVLVDRFAAPHHRLILPSLEVVVQEWSREAGLVARIEECCADAVITSTAHSTSLDARSEHCVKARLSCSRSAHEGDQGLHVERYCPAVLPGKCFVANAAPLATATTQRVITFEDGAIGELRDEEAGVVQ